MQLSNIQFITHSTENISYIESANLALEGGIKLIQLRMKGAAKEEVMQSALDLRILCQRYGAQLIVDDWVEIVNEVGIDGVHVGKEDISVQKTRTLLGKDKIIGCTANTFEDIVRGLKAGASYIGLGPYRYTTTKKKLSPILGLEGYKSILAKCKARNINIPIYAIGGIRMEDLKPLKEIGLWGVAISSMILQSPNPTQTTKEIIQNWK